jgi:thymidine kinase
MSVTVCVGPMGAGKTTWLLEHYRSLQGKPGVRPPLLVKHARDTRAMANCVETHDGLTVHADAVATDGMLLPTLCPAFDSSHGLAYSAIFIDEGHFFDGLVCAVDTIALLGIDVFVAALDADSMRRPFPSIAELCAHADRIVKLVGHCERCDKPSLYSFRRGRAGPQVAQRSVGGFDLYGTLCRRCYDACVDRNTGVER